MYLVFIGIYEHFHCHERNQQDEHTLEVEDNRIKVIFICIWPIWFEHVSLFCSRVPLVWELGLRVRNLVNAPVCKTSDVGMKEVNQWRIQGSERGPNFAYTHASCEKPFHSLNSPRYVALMRALPTLQTTIELDHELSHPPMNCADSHSEFEDHSWDWHTKKV
jgi:hypothetical protein